MLKLRKIVLTGTLPFLVSSAFLAGSPAASAAQPKPINDNFANAYVMSGGGGQLAIQNDTATIEPGEPAPIPGHAPAASLWYRWTAPKTGPVTLTTKDSYFDTVLSVYTGSSLKALTQVAANDDASFDGVATHFSKVTFTAKAGTTYHVAIDGYTPQTVGWAELSWTSNDDFSASEKLSPASFWVWGANVAASAQPGEPLHAAVPGGHSVWYSWTPSTNGIATVQVDGPNFDTLLAAYTGSAVNGLTPVASNDNLSASDTDSRIDFPVTAGKTYRIAVDGKAGAQGWFVIDGSVTGPALTVTGTSTPEGNSGSRALPFTLSLSQPSATNVVVNYTTANGTASAGSDYTAMSGTVTFAPGQTSKVVNVVVQGDKLKEPNESVKLNVTRVTGGGVTLGSSSVGVISNDD